MNGIIHVHEKGFTVMIPSLIEPLGTPFNVNGKFKERISGDILQVK